MSQQAANTAAAIAKVMKLHIQSQWDISAGDLVDWELDCAHIVLLPRQQLDVPHTALCFQPQCSTIDNKEVFSRDPVETFWVDQFHIHCCTLPRGKAQDHTWSPVVPGLKRGKPCTTCRSLKLIIRVNQVHTLFTCVIALFRLSQKVPPTTTVKLSSDLNQGRRFFWPIVLKTLCLNDTYFLLFNCIKIGFLGSQNTCISYNKQEFSRRTSTQVACNH